MPNGNGHSARLDSWKDIATYLRRDVRTAIRWEQQRGLPVRRVPGGGRKAVFAYTAELDAWLMQETAEPQGLKPDSLRENYGTSGTRALPGFAQPQHFSATAEAGPVPYAPPAEPVLEADVKASRAGDRRWSYYLALVAAAVLITLVVIAFESRINAGESNFPVRVGFTLNTLQAFDAEGRLLWSHPLPGIVNPGDQMDWRRPEDGVRIADFRGDGDREVLVVLMTRLSPNATHPDHSEVDMFSSRGQLLWSYIPHGHLVFPTHDLKDSWNALDVFVSENHVSESQVSESHVSGRQGRKQIWVAVDHAVWGHSFIVNLDPETGKDTLRYVNSGTTVALNELATPRGNFLLVGGFNNEYDSGTLAVIDEAKSFAVSPQTEGTNHKCLNCAKGDPDYYFVFPRSEVNELMKFYEDRVYTIRVSDEEIELRKKETEWNVGAQSLYLLKKDGPIRPFSVTFDTSYDLLHNKLEREGKINHSLAECPERLRPRPVRMWTRKGGWTEVKLEPGRSTE